MPRRKKEIVVDESVSQNEKLRENESIEAPKVFEQEHAPKNPRSEKQLLAAAKRAETLKQKQDALIAQKALQLVEEKFNNKPTLPIKEQPNDEVIIVKKKRKTILSALVVICPDDICEHYRSIMMNDIKVSKSIDIEQKKVLEIPKCLTIIW